MTPRPVPSSRPRRGRRIAVALGSLALLAGCSSAPGSAFTVDGTSVAMSEVDDQVAAFCEFQTALSQAQGVAATTVPASDIRSLVAQVTLQETVAQQELDDRGLTVPDSDWRVGADERAELETTFPDADVDDLILGVEAQRRITAMFAAIGADEGVDDVARAGASGAEVVALRIEDADVDVDPRLGELAGIDPDTAPAALAADTTDLATLGDAAADDDGGGGAGAGGPNASDLLPAEQRCGD